MGLNVNTTVVFENIYNYKYELVIDVCSQYIYFLKEYFKFLIFICRKQSMSSVGASDFPETESTGISGSRPVPDLGIKISIRSRSISV
jgi:hypothetical protein